jgi:hypothetical protein
MNSDERKPSQVFDEFWIRAVYKRKDNARSGKWMLFVPTKEIDQTWETIRHDVLKGLLGPSAKVATMMENKNAQRSDQKLICVYVSDYNDLSDVGRVLAQLRLLGFTGRLNFKTDTATLSGEYAFNSSGPVSLYTSPPNSYTFIHPGTRKVLYELPTTEVMCVYCENLVIVPASRTKDDLSDPLYSERVICGECRKRGITWDDVESKEDDDAFRRAVEKDD